MRIMFELQQPLGWVYLLIDKLFQNFGLQSNYMTEKWPVCDIFISVGLNTQIITV